MLELSSKRPKYSNNARIRLKKEAIYNHFLSKARMDRFFTGNVKYCGLSSVFFDRIFLLAYPLICDALVFENDPDLIGAVKEHIANINSSDMSNFINEIKFFGRNIFDLELHQGNKYGLVDLDSNQLTSYGGCKDIYELVRNHADDRCLVSIWNAVGMKGLKFEEQQRFMKEIVIDKLNEEYQVSKEEMTYDDTSLMYVCVLRLQRRV